MKFTDAVRRGLRSFSGILVFGLLAAASLAVGGQPAKDDFRTENARYLTHITTDRPVYRPGETLYVRAVLLSAITHSPLRSEKPVSDRPALVEIKSPRGDTVASAFLPIADSTIAFVWDIPKDQKGGEYRVRVSHPVSGYSPAERSFDIRGFDFQRITNQIEFLRDGYGPGDTVTANLHAERAAGGVPAGAAVSVVARVDNEDVWKGAATIDSAGNASASFKLPSVMTRGDGTIAMTIQDGGVVETATKTIPILLETLDLGIYPEGGDLIAGLSNRVYLEGRTINQKPADIAGIVVDEAGRQVAEFRTVHEGRGRFSFTPAAGTKYSLRITEPSGIKTVFPLPPVKESGAVIASTSNVTAKGRPVVVRVAATAAGAYDVVLSKRGDALAVERTILSGNESREVTLTVPKSVDGVFAVTAYDEKGAPMAERLVFRQSDRDLRIEVATSQTDFAPGGKVNLRVTTRDATGKPVPAVVGLTVTDATVLDMIDKREQAPRLPVMALLENDVRDLADAHIYLDGTHPLAEGATDLLLGTQGWRRFAALNPPAFLSAHGEKALRVLATTSEKVKLDAFFKSLAPGTGGLLVGVLTDITKAVLPGVSVTVVNKKLGVKTSTVTNDNGIFVFALTPGDGYSLRAEFPNFKTSEINGLKIPASTSTRVDIVMEIGELMMAVTVNSSSGGLWNSNRAPKEEKPRKTPLETKDPVELLPALPGFRSLPDPEFNANGGFSDPLIGRLAMRQEPLTASPFPSNTALNPNMITEIRLTLGPPVDFCVKCKVEKKEEKPEALRYEREYAHSRRTGWNETYRGDSTQTVYWNAGVRTSSSGRANVSFTLSDSVTSFRILADGFTADGALGSGIGTIESKQPFYIEPKVPLEVTSGDLIQLPVGMVNGLNRNLADVDVTGQAGWGGKFLPGSISGARTTLNSNERARRILPFEIGSGFSGVANIQLEGRAGPYRDWVTRTVTVKAPGFPNEVSAGGVLEANQSNSLEFTLPDDMVRGSVSSNIVMYPTPLANMTEALESLLAQPNGCFEQTSSTSYPMVMAQWYFVTHSGVDPRVVEKANGFLNASYKKLKSFESRSGGFELYGGDPGNEALTAYGLLQFMDMQKTREVDPELIKRTVQWLLSRRDGAGGFRRSASARGSIGAAPAETTNAYVTWALAESGVAGLEMETAAVRAHARTSNDSYILALASNILAATHNSADARDLMARLAKAQDSSGKVTGAVTSIMRSEGNSLDIEATALALLAWVREPEYRVNVEKAVRWLAGKNHDGRFGSTQSTVLALRAIVVYELTYGRPQAPGRVTLSVDGRTIGSPIAFTRDTQTAIVLPEIGRDLGPGKHTIVLRMENGAAMPFSAALKYHSVLPSSAPQSPIGLQVVLKDPEIREGGITEAVVSIKNRRNEAVASPIAIVGIPGGLEARHDQLKELVKSGRIDAYEVIGREVTLYWRAIDSAATVDVPLSLIAAVPGSYTAPASRAYAYYADEYKSWAAGMTVKIVPR